MHIPNTSISLVTFTVGYQEDTTEKFLSKVRSDQLRLVFQPKEEEKSDETLENKPEVKTEEEKPEVNENTGLGGWTTVSVSVVDSKKDMEDSLKAQEELRNGTFNDKVSLFISYILLLFFLFFAFFLS